MTLFEKHGRTLPLQEWSEQATGTSQEWPRLVPALRVCRCGKVARRPGGRGASRTRRDIDWNAFSTDDAIYLFRAASC
jgi:hypothetical protein